MPFAGAGESTGAFSESGGTSLPSRDDSPAGVSESYGSFPFCAKLAHDFRDIGFPKLLGLLDCIKQQIRKLRSTKSLVSLHVQSHCQ